MPPNRRSYWSGGTRSAMTLGKWDRKSPDGWNSARHEPIACARHTTLRVIFRSGGTARLPISVFSHDMLVVCLTDISEHKVSIKPVAPHLRLTVRARVCLHGLCITCLVCQSPVVSYRANKFTHNISSDTTAAITVGIFPEIKKSRSLPNNPRRADKLSTL